MCGIAGVLRFHGGRGTPPAADPGPFLARDLRHRGPDGGGFHREEDGSVLLVHRRLSILDPGESSAQPMEGGAGRYRLVYNGEVYNFRALRAALEAAGESFRSTGDTEVVLRVILREGTAGLARLRGMFALALWDARERSLLLARDRFGMKPLYLSRDADRVAFASEQQALRRAGLVGAGISAAGALAFLRWGSIPAPLSWLEGVEALRPGEWRRFHADGRAEAGAFADTSGAWRDAAPGTPPAPDLRERMRAAVLESVEAHRVADVPVGVFLSGGVDSGVLAAAARAGGAGDLRTFTVGLEEGDGDESAAAAETARRLGTEHATIRVRAADVAADLPRLLRHMDQPTLDGVNTWCVAKAVAGAGMKAVLSGTGGDEMFGGYPSFRTMARLEGPAARAGLRLGGGILAPAMGRRRGKWDHLRRHAGDRREIYRAHRGLLLPGEAEAIAGESLRGAGPEVAALEEAWLGGAEGEVAAASAARLETRGYLASQLLRDTDALSMAHSLEVRVPFVDTVLLAAAWPELGRSPAAAAGKRILREAFAGDLPPGAAFRRKRGFTLPFDAWMRGPLEERVRAGAAAAEEAGILAPGRGGDLLRGHREGRVHWSRAWAVAVAGWMASGGAA